MESWPGSGTIAPVERGMLLCPLLQAMKGMVSTDQAERATRLNCIRVAARFAGFVPTDVVIQITGYD